MTGPDYDWFCRLVRDRSGLVLSPEKAYLVQSRLQPIARESGRPGVPELLAALKSGREPALAERCVDAMNTHESFFFRDGSPFETLERALPGLIEARRDRRSLRIWSAACSSGQEAYSVAMLLQPFKAQLAGWRVEILGTDVSETILAKARRGVYNAFEVQRGLPEGQRGRWFVETPEGWAVSPELKTWTSFRTHNLLAGTAGLGAFDVVFCRNVLIYFDQATKGRVLDQIAGVLPDDGLLFLGSAETVMGLTEAFAPAPDARGAYRPVRAGLRKAG